MRRRLTSFMGCPHPFKLCVSRTSPASPSFKGKANQIGYFGKLPAAEQLLARLS